MALRCKIFGHKPPIYGPKGWWSPGDQYGRISNLTSDNCGRIHAQITAECPRCREKVMIARCHIRKDALLDLMSYHERSQDLMIETLQKCGRLPTPKEIPNNDGR